MGEKDRAQQAWERSIVVVRYCLALACSLLTLRRRTPTPRFLPKSLSDLPSSTPLEIQRIWEETREAPSTTTKDSSTFRRRLRGTTLSLPLAHRWQRSSLCSATTPDTPT